MKTPKLLKGKKLEQAISEAYLRHFNRVPINMMDVGKIYRAAETAYTTHGTIQAMDDALAPLVAVYQKF